MTNSIRVESCEFVDQASCRETEAIKRPAKAVRE